MLQLDCGAGLASHRLGGEPPAHQPHPHTLETDRGGKDNFDGFKLLDRAQVAILDPLLPWQPPDPTTSFATFSSFTSDGQFWPAAAALPRRLLFLGDSDTAGYCAAGTPDTAAPLRNTENARDSWAVQLAALLGAEPVLEAVSGIGVENKGGLGGIWRRSLPAVPVLHWDPATWPPHAVLLLIGPNDDLSDEAHFVSLYLGLLEVGGRVCCSVLQ